MWLNAPIPRKISIRTYPNQDIVLSTDVKAIIISTGDLDDEISWNTFDIHPVTKEPDPVMGLKKLSGAGGYCFLIKQIKEF